MWRKTISPGPLPCTTMYRIIAVGTICSVNQGRLGEAGEAPTSAEATRLVTLRVPGCAALVGVTEAWGQQNLHLSLKAAPVLLD
jgi:hypothetical protein